jgi:hypothetical protein
VDSLKVLDPERPIREADVGGSTEPFLDVRLNAIWIVPVSGETVT